MQTWRSHLKEVFVKVNAVQPYLWRAVHHEGEVHETFVSKSPDKKTALKFLTKQTEQPRRSRQMDLSPTGRL